jgi:hypothetical protein
MGKEKGAINRRLFVYKGGQAPSGASPLLSKEKGAFSGAFLYLCARQGAWRVSAIESTVVVDS